MQGIISKIFSEDYKSHYKDTLKLAYPVIIAQAGHMIGGIADSVMVGQISGVQLAASALANSIYIIPTLFGLGVLTALTPIIGKAYGEKNFDYIKRVFPLSLLLGLVMGIFLYFIMSQTSFIFKY